MFQKKERLLPLFVSLLFSSLFLALNVFSAQAAAVPQVSTATEPLSIVGFDKTVAQQHGYVIVTLPDGKQASIPEALSKLPLARIEQAVGPYNRIYGNCGYSYIYLYRNGGSFNYRVSTGFHVNTAAVAYHWQYRIQGPLSIYNKTFTHAGGLFFRHDWSAVDYRSTQGHHGRFKAQVIRAGSDVILDNGSVCVSAALQLHF